MFRFVWEALGWVMVPILLASKLALTAIGAVIGMTMMVTLGTVGLIGAFIFGPKIAQANREKGAKQMQQLHDYNEMLLAYARRKPKKDAPVDEINQYIQDEMEQVAQEEGEESNYPSRPM